MSSVLRTREFSFNAISTYKYVLVTPPLVFTIPPQNLEISLPNTQLTNQYVGIRILFLQLTLFARYAPRQINHATLPLTSPPLLCMIAFQLPTYAMTPRSL